MALYGQLAYQFAGRRGPQDADVADVAQFVIRAISEEIQRRDYSSRRESFCNWLLVVTWNHVAKHLERRRTSNRAAADGFHEALLQNCVAEDYEPAWWEREHRGRAFHVAADHVRSEFEDSSWQAFWRTAVDGEAAKAAGQSLGMSTGAVIDRAQPCFEPD